MLFFRAPAFLHFLYLEDPWYFNCDLILIFIDDLSWSIGIDQIIWMVISLQKP